MAAAAPPGGVYLETLRPLGSGPHHRPALS